MTGTSESQGGVERPRLTNPYVGPRPIQLGEPLFGRTAEVAELYHFFQARRIVVFHSPSGAGKSSLVQAGLIPRLREGGFDVWRPIRVHLDPRDLEGVAVGVNRYLLSVLVSLEEELPAARRRSPAELARMDLPEYLESRPRRKGREDSPVVLLFDQFEEVLTVAPREVGQKQAFFSALGKALETGRYWALFIVREKYVAAFAPYRDRIPTQMLNTLRLDLLGLEAAREVAEQIARTGGRHLVASEQLIHDLSLVDVLQPNGSVVAEPGLYVHPVQLQVVCLRLWDAMPEYKRQIEAEDIAAHARVWNALRGYYADTVNRIAGKDVAVEWAVRAWLGSKLIVGGMRTQVRREAKQSAGLANELIEELVNAHLIQIEQRAGENWFELSHDRLVEAVQWDNHAWERELQLLRVQAGLWDSWRQWHGYSLRTSAFVQAVSPADKAASEPSQGPQTRRRAAWARWLGIAVVTIVVAIVLWEALTWVSPFLWQ